MATRTKLLLGCILLLFLITSCSNTEAIEKSGSNAELYETFEKGLPLDASFTDARLSNMKGVADNGTLQLFIDAQTGEIAVLHKKTGEIWYSNPPDREQDSLASGINKGILSSQIKLDFYNSFGQLNSVNSYSDSVVYNQINAKKIENGVMVTYMFGTNQKSADDMPMMISKERMEEHIFSKLDKTGQRALKIAYTEDEENGVYVRNDSALKGLQLERALKAFEDAGYTEEDLLFDIAENNVTQTKPEPRIFLASIEYVLDGDSLVAKVPVSSIVYPDNYPVSTVSLLNFFGASGIEEQGSIFIPDGSGALIHFNNGKTQYPAYQQPVYGTDRTYDRVEEEVRTQEVKLPVFGMIRESSAFLAIIEEGDAVASISADISGRLNSYNYVHPIFTLLNKGELYLDANGQQRTIPRFQEEPSKTDFTVRYVFLDSDHASYQGLAHAYQNYLIENNGLPQRAKEIGTEDIPFYLKLVGSISKKKHFAGIPYQALEPLTTFEQAQIIASQLKARGIDHIKLKYSGWFNGGLDHKVPDKIKVDGAVGGNKGLLELIEYAKLEGITLYPDVSLLIANTGAGFSEKKEAARTLRDVPADIYPLNIATNRRDRTKSPSYVISPRYVNQYVNSVLKGFTHYHFDAISLNDLAAQLNSDYRKGEQIDRAESKRIAVQALQQIYNEQLSILADSGNAYALPYLNDITNAPMSNSKFKIEDEEIPFYQMVVRGFLEYTGSPYNLSSYTDVNQYILKTLEYGAGIYFEWIYEPNFKVKDTEYNQLYAVNYQLWIDQAAEIYEEVNEVLKNVRNARIVDHKKLLDGVYKTEYENGVYVIVNYNSSQVTVDGKIIEAVSYITGGGQS